MYFDVWTSDILKAIQLLKGKISPDDCLLGNAVLFKLMKSPLWRHEFEGAALVAHQDDSGYSYIDLPGFDDPDNNKLSIRDGTTFNLLDHRYEYPMYCEEGYELWSYSRAAEKKVMAEPPHLDYLREVLDLLSENPYYRQFLTNDPQELDEFMEKTRRIEYNVLEEKSTQEIIQSTGISRYDTEVVTHLFGHRYAKCDSNRKYVVAQNSLGPVGILSLFDHSAPGVSHGQTDLLSVSFVSVTPGYRRLGIASGLMRTAFDYCLSHKKMLGRTEPSEIGRLTVDHFSQLAKTHAPSLPFMNRQEMLAMSMMQRAIPGLRTLPYAQKCKVIQKGLALIREHEFQMFDLTDAQELALKQYCETFNNASTQSFGR
jgi:GNAT superfamily N-acetyltransferase